MGLISGLGSLASANVQDGTTFARRADMSAMSDSSHGKPPVVLPRIENIMNLHESLVSARSAVEEQDPSVQIPESDLHGILDRIKALENEVSALLDGDDDGQHVEIKTSKLEDDDDQAGESENESSGSVSNALGPPGADDDGGRSSQSQKLPGTGSAPAMKAADFDSKDTDEKNKGNDKAGMNDGVQVNAQDNGDSNLFKQKVALETDTMTSTGDSGSTTTMTRTRTKTITVSSSKQAGPSSSADAKNKAGVVQAAKVADLGSDEAPSSSEAPAPTSTSQIAKIKSPSSSGTSDSNVDSGSTSSAPAAAAKPANIKAAVESPSSTPEDSPTATPSASAPPANVKAVKASSSKPSESATDSASQPSPTPSAATKPANVKVAKQSSDEAADDESATPSESASAVNNAQAKSAKPSLPQTSGAPIPDAPTGLEAKIKAVEESSSKSENEPATSDVPQATIQGAAVKAAQKNADVQPNPTSPAEDAANVENAVTDAPPPAAQGTSVKGPEEVNLRVATTKDVSAQSVWKKKGDEASATAAAAPPAAEKHQNIVAAPPGEDKGEKNGELVTSGLAGPSSFQTVTIPKTPANAVSGS